MNTYKRLKEAIEQRIEFVLQGMDKDSGLNECFDVWVALSERDTETPESEKREKAREYAEIAEEILVDPSTKNIMSWTFSLIALRQAAGMAEENEEKAQLYHIAP